MLVGDVCNLDCLKRPKQPQEFIGPVKIVLVDTPARVYWYKCFMGALLNLAFFCMGTVIMTIMFYTLSFSKFTLKMCHIVMGTLGLQLLIPAGLFNVNSLNASTAVMKKPERITEHAVTSGVGFVYAIVAGVASQVGHREDIDFNNATPHAIFGFMAIAFHTLAILTGPVCHFELIQDEDICFYIKIGHTVTGILAFLLSTQCFLTGCARPEIMSWLPQQHMLTIIVICTVFYTIVACLSPIVRYQQESLKKRADQINM